MSIWALMRRIPSLRWVMIQAGLAALFAALARAPRLGRPRPDPPSGADRPAEHALALGTLLARAKAAGKPMSCSIATSDGDSRECLDAGEPGPVPTAGNSPTRHDGAAASSNLT